eukprot:3852918-Rhodomonas_salina.1
MDRRRCDGCFSEAYISATYSQQDRAREREKKREAERRSRHGSSCAELIEVDPPVAARINCVIHQRLSLIHI